MYREWNQRWSSLQGILDKMMTQTWSLKDQYNDAVKHTQSSDKIWSFKMVPCTEVWQLEKMGYYHLTTHACEKEQKFQQSHEYSTKHSKQCNTIKRHPKQTLSYTKLKIVKCTSYDNQMNNILSTSKQFRFEYSLAGCRYINNNSLHPLIGWFLKRFDGRY